MNVPVFVSFPLLAAALCLGCADEPEWQLTGPPTTVIDGLGSADTGDAAVADNVAPGPCDFPQSQALTPDSQNTRLRAALCWPSALGFNVPPEQKCVKTVSGQGSSCSTWITFYRWVDDGTYYIQSTGDPLLPLVDTTHGSISSTGNGDRIDDLPADTDITVHAGSDGSREVIFRFEGDSVVVQQGE